MARPCAPPSAPTSSGRSSGPASTASKSPARIVPGSSAIPSMWTRSVPASVALLAALSGCATIPWQARPRPPAPLAPALADYYAARGAALTARAEPLQAEPSSRWIAQRVTLEAPGMPHPIRLDWYAPPGEGRRAAGLIFPILSGNDLGGGESARGFARQGIHGIIVYRPKEKFSMEKPLGQLEENFHATARSEERRVGK